jgi:lipoprotein signal peptidase
MKKLQNLSLGFIGLALVLIIADLIIKYFIIRKFEPGEIISLLNGGILAGRIENLRIPFGFNGGLGIFGYIVVAIQLTFVMFSIRIQKREIDKFFKFSSALIVFGWIGNYLDRLFFAYGNWAYVHLDYFNFAFAGNSFINLSSLMLLFGWIILAAISVIKFQEFKSLFRKEKSSD